MSTIVKICATAFLALCAILLLRDSKHSHTGYIVIAVGIAVASRVVINLSEAVGCLQNLADGTSVSGYLPTLLRAAGISYITDFTSGLCRDAGEENIAGYVEIAGRSELILLSLPLISELAELSFGMLNL